MRCGNCNNYHKNFCHEYTDRSGRHLKVKSTGSCDKNLSIGSLIDFRYSILKTFNNSFSDLGIEALYNYLKDRDYIRPETIIENFTEYKDRKEWDMRIITIPGTNGFIVKEL